MKIECTHGEATQVVADQMKEVARQLTAAAEDLSNGNVKKAYAATNFDLAKRTLENFETLAGESA